MKKLIHRTGILTHEDHNIVRIKFTGPVTVELNDMYDYIEFIDQVFSGEKIFFIIDTLDNFPTGTPEARKYLGSDPKALKNRAADLILVNNLPVRIIAKFYAKWDRKDNHEVKIFSTNEKAMKWIADQPNNRQSKKNVG